MAELHVHIGHHFFGAGNLGDDLMLAGFLEAARPMLLGNVRLTCCIPHEAGSQRLRFPEITWLPYDEPMRAAAIAGCNLWLGLGGTPFQIANGPWFVDHLIQEAAWCCVYHKPMFYLGVGVNDSQIVDEPQVRILIDKAEAIWTRDEYSAAVLRPFAGSGKVSVGADLAHIALATVPFRPPELDTFGLILNFEDPRQYRIDQIAALVESPHGKRVVWLSQEVRTLLGSESALYEQLPPAVRKVAALGVPDYPGARTSGELVRAWGVPAWLFTSRYHGALIGAWMGCRTLAFARSAKVAAGARQLGQPIVESLGNTRRILRRLEEAEPTSRLLLQELTALARGACDAFLVVATRA